MCPFNLVTFALTFKLVDFDKKYEGATENNELSGSIHEIFIKRCDESRRNDLYTHMGLNCTTSHMGNKALCVEGMSARKDIKWSHLSY